MAGVLRAVPARFFSLGPTILLCCVPAPAAARVVINELYYDHPGADAGHEFIELAADDAGAFALAGCAVEFHNGAGTGWSVVWRAADADSVPRDGRFLIGGEQVLPAADAVVALALQNGPDAIRLVDATGAVLDLVGYGGLDDPPYVEATGVPPAPAGKSIARRQDGVDTGDNAADFAEAEPTPGRRNVARHDVAVVLGAGTAARAASDPRVAERIAVRVENRGLAPVPPGAVSVTLEDSSAAGVAPIATGTHRDGILPGDAATMVLRAALASGYHWLRARSTYAGDERDGNDAVELLRRAGRIPLLVSEVWSAPPAGCPQFVELFNAGDTPVNVGGFSLRDARARPVLITGGPRWLAPGAWMALTSDAPRLVACAGIGGDVAAVDGSWPVFNRTGGVVADSVVVLDAHGIPVDAVGYPGLTSASAGRSLERVDLFLHDGPPVWRVCDAPRGATPALPNTAFLDHPAPAFRIEAAPNPFSPATGEILRVAIGAAPGIARVDVTVYDAGGRRVAVPGRATTLPALVVWDGRGDDGALARPGLYVVACEAWRADGTRASVQKVVVGCAALARP